MIKPFLCRVSFKMGCNVFLCFLSDFLLFFFLEILTILGRQGWNGD